MITVKLEKIVNSFDNLEKLSKVKMPTKASYCVSKILSKVKSEMKLFEEKNIELIKLLGEEDSENKDVWNVKPENRDEWGVKMKELLDIDVQFDFNEIDIKELGDTIIEPELLVDWLFKME